MSRVNWVGLGMGCSLIVGLTGCGSTAGTSALAPSAPIEVPTDPSADPLPPADPSTSALLGEWIGSIDLETGETSLTPTHNTANTDTANLVFGPGSGVSTAEIQKVFNNASLQTTGGQTFASVSLQIRVTNGTNGILGQLQNGTVTGVVLELIPITLTAPSGSTPFCAAGVTTSTRPFCVEANSSSQLPATGASGNPTGTDPVYLAYIPRDGSNLAAPDETNAPELSEATRLVRQASLSINPGASADFGLRFRYAQDAPGNGQPRVTSFKYRFRIVADQRILPQPFVNTLADENGSNLARCSLREAIVANNTDAAFGGCADPAGTITFAPSLTGTISLTGSGLPTITQSVTIDGPGAATLTVNGNQQVRVLDAGNGTSVTVEGLTIANGEAPTGQDGGGIRTSGSLTVTNCTLTGNSARYGGAIAGGYGTTISVSNSTLSGNSAGVLGGGILGNGGSVSATNSTLSGNTASAGGGILSLGGTVNVSNSTLSGNSASAGGGLLINQRGNLSVSGTTLSNNSASNIGGGIQQSEGTLSVSNSSLSGNSSPYGGAIAGYAATLTVSSSTLSGNTAALNGGAIRINGSPSQRGTLSVSNSTLKSNSANAFGGAITGYLSTVNVTSSTVSGNSGQYGGAIGVVNTTAVVTRSTLSGNTAQSGGGIQTRGGTVTVINTTLSGNFADVNGGGIDSIPSASGPSTVNLTNSTLSGNSAPSAGGIGGGIRNSGTITLRNSTLTGNFAGLNGGGIRNQYSGRVTTQNTIISGNTAISGFECYNTGAAFTANANNLFGFTGNSFGCPTGINDVVPGVGVLIGNILSPLANNGGFSSGAAPKFRIRTHALPPGSPALNAGNNATIPAGVSTDQRGSGFPRIQNGTVDIGAFEAP